MKPVLLSFLAVACGGAIGASARYAISLGFQKLGDTSFPYSTITVNLIGSFLIGLASVYFLQETTSANARLFIITGVFGALTTFSTFSLECLELIHGNKLKMAVSYILMSNTACIAAVFCAVAIGRKIWTVQA
jgi:fluoride exporter